jgi:hypothetical protein
MTLHTLIKTSKATLRRESTCRIRRTHARTHARSLALSLSATKIIHHGGGGASLLIFFARYQRKYENPEHCFRHVRPSISQFTNQTTNFYETYY